MKELIDELNWRIRYLAGYFAGRRWTVEPMQDGGTYFGHDLFEEMSKAIMKGMRCDEVEGPRLITEAPDLVMRINPRFVLPHSPNIISEVTLEEWHQALKKYDHDHS